MVGVSNRVTQCSRCLGQFKNLAVRRNTNAQLALFLDEAICRIRCKDDDMSESRNGYCSVSACCLMEVLGSITILWGVTQCWRCFSQFKKCVVRRNTNAQLALFLDEAMCRIAGKDDMSESSSGYCSVLACCLIEVLESMRLITIVFLIIDFLCKAVHIYYKLKSGIEILLFL